MVFRFFIFVLIGFLFTACNDQRKSKLTETYFTLDDEAIPLADSGKLGRVFMTITPDCPLAQSYTYAFNELNKKFGSQLEFYGVLSGELYTKNEIQHFIDSFGYDVPILLDSQLNLAHALGAQVTPEFFLLNPINNLMYRGKMDDWAISLGRKRITADSNYLEWAIESFLNSKPIAIKKTTAVGCIIEY